jgi:hypothetical protein
MANASKNFMWRACHDLLPTRDNLVRKKIAIDPMCPICGLKAETTFHILWACPSLMDVWWGGHAYSRNSFHQLLIFCCWLREYIRKVRENNFIIFMETSRKILFRRNRWIHEGFFTPPNEIGRMASMAVEDFVWCNESKLVEDTNSEVTKKNETSSRVV